MTDASEISEKIEKACRYFRSSLRMPQHTESYPAIQYSSIALILYSKRTGVVIGVVCCAFSKRLAKRIAINATVEMESGDALLKRQNMDKEWQIGRRSADTIGRFSKETARRR